MALSVRLFRSNDSGLGLKDLSNATAYHAIPHIPGMFTLAFKASHYKRSDPVKIEMVAVGNSGKCLQETSCFGWLDQPSD